MKVLMVIATWNYPEHTKACVDSIRKTVPPLPYRIFIVDNGSSEENFERIEQLKSRDDIEIVKNSVNLLHNARNKGIKKAVDEGYDFACCMDNDLILLPNCLKNMIDVGSEPGVGLVDPMLTYRGDAGWSEQYAYLPDEIEVKLRETLKTGQLDDEDLLKWYEEHWAYGQGIGQQVKVADSVCNMFSTELVKKIGYVDEELGASYQRWEQDYGYRVLQAGYRQMVCKSAFLYHFNVGAVTISRRDYYTRDMNKPNERMEEKYGKEISEKIGTWTREAIYLSKGFWRQRNELSKWINRKEKK